MARGRQVGAARRGEPRRRGRARPAADRRVGCERARLGRGRRTGASGGAGRPRRPDRGADRGAACGYRSTTGRCWAAWAMPVGPSCPATLPPRSTAPTTSMPSGGDLTCGTHRHRSQAMSSEGPSRLTLLIFADSLAYYGPTGGLPADDPRIWPDIVAGQLGWELELIGRIGWTCRDIWWAATQDPRAWAALPRAGAVIFATGGMDSLPSPLPTALRELIRYVRPPWLRRWAREGYGWIQPRDCRRSPDPHCRRTFPPNTSKKLVAQSISTVRVSRSWLRCRRCTSPRRTGRHTMDGQVPLRRSPNGPTSTTFRWSICQVGLVPGVICYDPAQMRHAYNIDTLLNAGYTGAGRTIVIVDSYQSPTLSDDLDAFDANYGLPDRSTFFTQIAPDGLTPFDPSDNNMVGWSAEISLDVEWAHAIAPGANVVLDLAKSSDDADILSATQYAVDHNLGDVISQSFGENESCVNSGILNAEHQLFLKATLKHITLVASSGDQGAAQPTCDGSSWVKAASSPASDPLVTAVGGTELHAADYCLAKSWL